MKSFKRLIFALGAFQVARFSYDVGYEIYARNSREPLNLKNRYGENSYAVVTGSTDGLGKSYAKEFARRGLNVVLVARNEEKLALVKAELENDFGVSVRCIKYDFLNSTNYQSLLEIENQIRDLDVSILVNNVGIFAVNNFVDLTPKEINDLLVVNTFPTTFLSHAFARNFLKRNKKSAIINVGSENGEVPYAYMQTYSATKAFDNQLTKSLIPELQDKIDVVLHVPGPTETPMTNAVGSTMDPQVHKLFFSLFGKLFSSKPNDSVRDVIDRLGYDNYIAGTPKHTAAVYVAKAISPLSDYLRAMHGRFLVDALKEKRERNW